MAKLRIQFQLSEEVLREKFQPLIDKFNLSIEYEEGAVTIIGPRDVIEQIQHAYQVKQVEHQMESMMGGFGGFNVNFN